MMRYFCVIMTVDVQCTSHTSMVHYFCVIMTVDMQCTSHNWSSSILSYDVHACIVLPW